MHKKTPNKKYLWLKIPILIKAKLKFTKRGYITLKI